MFNRFLFVTVFATAIVVAPQLSGAHPALASQVDARAALSARQAVINRRSRLVMPFSMSRSMHMFEPTASGGIQTVMSKDGDATQVRLIRQHLKNEAAEFQAGRFDDPATLHGRNMPGLQTLRYSAKRMRVTYQTTEAGAQIMYVSRDPRVITALHQWFKAQVSDHGSHAMMMR